MKRLLLVSIVCILVSIISCLVLASYTIVDSGCEHRYDEYQPDGYNLAWCRVNAINQNYTVTVGVSKGGNVFGLKSTIASKDHTTYCTSYKVPGYGSALPYWTVG